MSFGHTIGQHYEVRALNGAEITDPPRLDGPRFDPCPEGSYCFFLGGVFNQTGEPNPPHPPELNWRSYYFAGGKRIAMREVTSPYDPFGTVTWLLGDHLGSTSLSVSESGGVLAEAKYTPWGDQRNLAGDLPTDYGYTGQREESALGLMYYVARWYDSGIGHFVQADTVVPGAGNPAAWNRYAYVMYNPIKYVDPSGHIPECGPDGMFCDLDKLVDPVSDNDIDPEVMTQWMPSQTGESSYVELEIASEDWEDYKRGLDDLLFEEEEDDFLIHLMFGVAGVFVGSLLGAPLSPIGMALTASAGFLVGEVSAYFWPSSTKDSRDLEEAILKLDETFSDLGDDEAAVLRIYHQGGPPEYHLQSNGYAIEVNNEIIFEVSDYIGQQMTGFFTEFQP